MLGLSSITALFELILTRVL